VRRANPSHVASLGRSRGRRRSVRPSRLSPLRHVGETANVASSAPGGTRHAPRPRVVGEGLAPPASRHYATSARRPMSRHPYRGYTTYPLPKTAKGASWDMGGVMEIVAFRNAWRVHQGRAGERPAPTMRGRVVGHGGRGGDCAFPGRTACPPEAGGASPAPTAPRARPRALSPGGPSAERASSLLPALDSGPWTSSPRAWSRPTRRA
jgi:hypothetical protein